MCCTPSRTSYAACRPRPTTPHFGLLWGLHNTGQSVGGSAGTADADIDAPEAWDITTGSPATTVAIVDTGIEAGHPDLAPQIWSNPGETGAGRETNGIDDDQNGYVDDSRRVGLGGPG